MSNFKDWSRWEVNDSKYPMFASFTRTHNYPSEIFTSNKNIYYEQVFSIMNYKHTAGMLLFIGAVQFVLGMLIAEFSYPGYSVSGNYISDLGATCRTTCIIYQPSASIFNISVSLFGVLVLVSLYFIWHEFHNGLISLLLGFSGVGIVGVGLFPETAGTVHLIVSFITFFFGGLFAIAAYKLVKVPFTYLSVLMGVICLITLALFIAKFFLGLGPGGMERMIAYPLLLWVIGFGGNLMSSEL